MVVQQGSGGKLSSDWVHKREEIYHDKLLENIVFLQK